VTFEIVEREIPSPGPGQVRIKVQACGVCHSDLYTKDGLWPDLQFPRIPGQEVAGVIDEVGSGVTTWKKGDRAGVGWHGGQDNTCPACRAGDFANCESPWKFPVPPLSTAASVCRVGLFRNSQRFRGHVAIRSAYRRARDD
jgi:D-arabinose 1-dehydrogenase-like Zn-dependent alcohol dehydrogenase